MRAFCLSVEDTRRRDHLLEVAPRQGAVARARARAAVQVGGDLGDREDRAGGPDGGLDLRARDGLLETLQPRADRLAQGLLVARGQRVRRDVEVREAHRAEVEALGEEHLLSLGDDDLRRAAADVEDEERVAGGRKVRAHGPRDEARLLLPRDHGEADPRLAPRAPDELAAVRRLAHGARRDGRDRLGARRARERRVAREAVEAVLHRLLGERALGERLLPEADHLLLAQDLERVARDPRDRAARRGA